MKKLILLTLAVVITLTLSAQNHKGKHETKSDKKKVAKKSTEAVTTQKPAPVPGIGAVIKFPTTSHDFGTVDEGVRATFEFEFTNIGDSDLILTNVQASCGCTVPTWPRQPIKPGQKDKITVVYNSSGRPGDFHKSITVTSNMKLDGVKTLFIQGKVNPKPVETPQPVSPVKINQN